VLNFHYNSLTRNFLRKRLRYFHFSTHFPFVNAIIFQEFTRWKKREALFFNNSLSFKLGLKLLADNCSAGKKEGNY